MKIKRFKLSIALWNIQIYSKKPNNILLQSIGGCMNKKALLEAALFVSDSPLTVERLTKVLGIGSEEQVKQLITEQPKLKWYFQKDWIPQLKQGVHNYYYK